MKAETGVWHVIHKPTATTLCGQPNDGTKPAEGDPCGPCAVAMYDVFGDLLDELEAAREAYRIANEQMVDATGRAATAQDELGALRAEVAELEKPHACAYSGMAVAECVDKDVCDCFGGSTWPQRAMTAESEVMRLTAALDALVKDKADHDFIGVARLRQLTKEP